MTSPNYGEAANVLTMFAQSYYDKAAETHRLDFDLGHLNTDLNAELTRAFGDVGRVFERYADAAREIAFAESTPDDEVPCLRDSA